MSTCKGPVAAVWAHPPNFSVSAEGYGLCRHGLFHHLLGHEDNKVNKSKECKSDGKNNCL